MTGLSFTVVITTGSFAKSLEYVQAPPKPLASESRMQRAMSHPRPRLLRLRCVFAFGAVKSCEYTGASLDT